MEKAIQDLVWLSNRFSGILELKDTLVDFDNLNNKTKELQTSSDSIKKEIEGLTYKKNKILEETDKFNKDSEQALRQTSVKISEELDNAKAIADIIVSDAKTEATSILMEAKDKKASVDKQTAEVQIKLNQLSEEIKVSEDRLNRAKLELEALRGRL